MNDVAEIMKLVIGFLGIFVFFYLFAVVWRKVWHFIFEFFRVLRKWLKQ